jgi:hypothetical protein
MPDKSGLPSAVRGAGALRFGRPAAVLGTPAVGYFTHCAPTGKAVANNASTMNLVIWLSGRLVIE